MTRRTERLGNLIRQEISQLLQDGIKDPRLGSLISVTKVIISPDLRNAKVLVSILGNDAEKTEVLKGFTSASGFFRRELAHSLTIRRVPELSFQIDNSIEEGAKVLRLLDTLTDKSQDKK